jgi:DNA-binding transcriptional ArsR family regulator
MKLDTTFAALADPTRRAILTRLASGECCATKLAAPFRVSFPAISKHLRVLEQAGLIIRRKEGRQHHFRLTVEPLRQAGGWISECGAFWEQQLDSLAEYLSKEESSWEFQQSGRPTPSRSSESSRRPGKKSSAPGRSRKR